MKFKIKSVRIIMAFVMVFGVVGYFAHETNAQGKAYKIGDRGPAGGWIFHDKGSNSDGWRYLEAAPEDQSKGSHYQYIWGCYGNSIPGAQGIAIGTGKSNTLAIANSCEDANTASKLCSAYRGGGKKDWFLPSKDELNLMYENLKKSGAGGFADDNYWSSSENLAKYGWSQLFSNGNQSSVSKFYSKRVRAVRAF